MKKKEKIIRICNVGVEKYWKSRKTIELPRLIDNMGTTIVNHYEEMNIWLTGPRDILILRQAVDSQYADYIKSLSVSLPTIWVTRNNHRPDSSITRLILEDSQLLSKISRVNQTRKNAVLIPYGISPWEEKLARQCGLKLHGVSSAIVRKVNSKTYSSQLNKELGLPGTGSIICRNFKELRQAFETLAAEKKEDEKIVLKEVLGASGSGQQVIGKQKEFESMLKFMERNYNDSPGFEILIEKWLPRKYDFNTQITISPEGGITLDGIKQLFTKKNGIHQGHFFPPDEEVLSGKEREQLETTAYKVGKRLYRDGYWGVVGMDSLKTRRDELIPLLEINCRFNMASFLTKISRQLARERKILAKSFDLLLKNPLSFGEVTEKLIGPPNLFSKEKGSGILVNNFATLNANFPKSGKDNHKAVKGKLFCVFIHETPHDIDEMEKEFTGRLMGFQQQVRSLN